MVTPEQVIDTISQLERRPGGTVRLTDVRAHLGDDPVVGEVLLKLNDARRIQLEPDPDRRGLTAEDHAAAVPLAGRPMHLARRVVR